MYTSNIIPFRNYVVCDIWFKYYTDKWTRWLSSIVMEGPRDTSTAYIFCPTPYYGRKYIIH